MLHVEHPCCTELKNKLVLFIDGELSAQECGCFVKHLTECVQCLEEFRRHEALKFALKCNCKNKNTDEFFMMEIKKMVQNQISAS